MPKIEAKKLIIFVAISIGILVIFEMLALIALFLSVTRYQDYWQKKAEEPGTFLYVALGDSAAQGIGATSPERGYVGLIAKKVSENTGKQVKIVNLSKSGAVIRDAIDNQIPRLQRLKPALVTIEIGANDIANFEPAKFESDFKELVSMLPNNTYVSNMPYFGSRAGRRQNAKLASEIISKILNEDKRLILVDLQSITEQRESKFNYAADYFHPNNRAYKNWAEAFWYEIQLNIMK